MLTIVFVFSAISGFTQNIVYRDLLGKWESAKGAVISYQFLDSANLKINSAKYGNSKAVYHLKIDGPQTILTINVDNNGIKQQTEYYVRRFDGTNLQLESTDTYDPIITKPFETGLWLVRQKS